MFFLCKDLKENTLKNVLYMHIENLETCLEQAFKENNIEFLEQFTTVYVDYANTHWSSLVDFDPNQIKIWTILTHLFLNDQIKCKSLRDLISYTLDKFNEKEEK